jgi:predicted ribosome quality control (RQC) complex YloA/Tae2 family protein
MKNVSEIAWMSCFARAFAIGVCGVIVSLVASASSETDRYEQTKINFQTEYSNALTKLAQAKARMTASEKALRKARQRNRLKGESRTAIYAEIEAAKVELEAAENNAARIPESARRAGVPPGWLREVEQRLASAS